MLTLGCQTDQYSSMNLENLGGEKKCRHLCSRADDQVRVMVLLFGLDMTTSLTSSTTCCSLMTIGFCSHDDHDERPRSAKPTPGRSPEACGRASSGKEGSCGTAQRKSGGCCSGYDR